MAKKRTFNKQHSEEELKKIIKTTTDGRYRLRVQVIFYILQNKSTEDIHKQLMVSTYSIFSWLKRYNEQGLEGLRSIKSGGRKEGNPIWDNSIFKALFEKLDQMQEYWSAPKMQVWIEKEFGVKIPERTIRYRLKKGGYSYKSSRPNPYKGDPKLQEEFKKKEL